MASSSSSSSSIVVHDDQVKYDVFISFRGEDTRHSLTSHIYAALRRKKIETYIDDKLERGHEISPALLRAIEQSKLSLVIFSENYASSSWCLDELLHILKCRHTNGQLVVPVFYGIDPSHVRKQKGSYGVELAKLQHRLGLSKVQEWRSALESAANLSGWDSQNTKPESKLVDIIVEDIINKLNSVCGDDGDDSKGLVGISKHIEEVMSLLNIDSNDNRVIGIWGIGGIGKTTLARVISTRLKSQFEGVYFLPNVREEAQKHGLHHLKTELWSNLLEEKTPSTSNMVMGSPFVKTRLRRKRVLIVLDDVNDSQHLELLVGDHGQRFGLGSRIIVTTRDRQVLRKGANEVYEVKGLDFPEALQLFQLNAFKNSSPPSTDYIKLSKRVVDYAKGVPLALEVLGSYLHSRSHNEWEDALNKLGKMPDKKIHDVLRISYDGLDDKEKDIFLDIACFFKGEKIDLVEKVLDGCDLSPKIGIADLINKSLITIKNNEVWMHDLLQQMGWEIVRQESKELGKRSRLWIADDVYRVLKSNTGTATIEGIFLDMSKMRDVDLKPEVFENMYNLRLLKIYNSNNLIKGCRLHFTKGLQCLPDALRYLHWYGYPLKSLPSNFNPKNLVVLEMPDSPIEQLWSENQNLEKLRKIDLSYSDNLTQFPDLSQAPQLEIMSLRGHTKLLQVPSYLESFDKLTELTLSGNSNLKNLTAIPRRIHYLYLDGTGIEELPSSIGSLDELSILDLSDNSNLKNLTAFPRRIQKLYLDGTGIKELPSSIGSLDELSILDLSGNSNLKNLTAFPRRIQELYLQGTGIEELPSSIGSLDELTILNLSGNSNLKNLTAFPRRIQELYLDGTGIKELPSSIGSLDKLYSLNLRNCKGLKKLSINMHKMTCLGTLNLYGCSSLDSLPDLPMNIRSLNLSETAIEQVPSKVLSSLQILDLGNCRRLKTVPKRYMPLTQSCYNFYCWPSYENISLKNCLQLDENALDNLMEYVQHRVWRIATDSPSLWPTPDYLYSDYPDFCVSYPGNKIPSWFSYQSEGSSISIKLPLQWLTANFLGFSLCVHAAFDNYNDDYGLVFETQSVFTTHSGESYKFHTSVTHWDENEFGDSEVRLVNADHLFMWYEPGLHVDGENWHTDLQNATEVSFEFNPTDLYDHHLVESCYVKKCGVCLIYGQDQDSTDAMDEDVGKPTVGESSKSKRPRQAYEPIGSVVLSDVGDEEDTTTFNHYKKKYFR